MFHLHYITFRPYWLSAALSDYKCVMASNPTEKNIFFSGQYDFWKHNFSSPYYPPLTIRARHNSEQQLKAEIVIYYV